MVNIERDSSGKTRIAKGDKSGLGGQYAPDTELLKKYASMARNLSESLRTHRGNPTAGMTAEEYHEALEAREQLENVYGTYNKEQQILANSLRDEEPVSDGTFTYFADFTYDSPVATSMSSPRSEDGQPKGWSLRVGTQRSSSKTGLPYYSTREEALDAVKLMKQAREENPYVKEQLAKYNPAKEAEAAVRLPSSAPKGPWDMKLMFIEPTPDVKNPKENGYHAGWCIVTTSPNYKDGETVFVSDQGYKTREEAEADVNIVNETIEGWEHSKDRSIFIEGKGLATYNSMTSEQYETIINHYAFKPRPWTAGDQLKDYYPTSKYQGD